MRHLYSGGMFHDPSVLAPPLQEHDDPHILARWYPFNTTWEVCAHCDQEILIPAFGRSRCPECGGWNLPCSMCGEVGDDGLIYMRCWDDCPYYAHEEVQCSLR